MKIASIWYDKDERDTIESLMGDGLPEWQVTSIHESNMRSVAAVVKVLGEYNLILVHLSTPPAFALKCAETVHREKLNVRVVLFSRTQADATALSSLFPGRIHPDKDVATLVPKLEAIVASPVSHLTDDGIEQAIVRVLNTDEVLSAQYREQFPVGYRAPFTIDDYHAFCRVHLMRSSVHDDRAVAPRVFIGHASDDHELVAEIRERLAAKRVETFVAPMDIESGSQWAESLRDELRSCAEMIVVLTPNSIDRPWVLVEAGAAWVLGKRVTPALAYVDDAKLPGPLSSAQARRIHTESGKTRLVNEIAERLGIALVESVPRRGEAALGHKKKGHKKN